LGFEMAPRRRATIKDIALATDLSQAAVSYALRGVQTSAETQERVRIAAEELGYTGNAVARALAKGRTGLIGVLAASLQDLSEQRFVESVGQALERNDLHMVLIDSGGDPERETMLAYQLADLLVDGLIVSPLDPSNKVWEDLASVLPVVSVGDALPGPTVGEVIFDNRAGVSMVLEHLRDLGHRRIAVLTPSRPTTPARPAERRVHEVAAALHLDAVTVNSRHSIEAATETATSLLNQQPRPTAIFCLSDSIACGVYAAANALRLSIPEDVSVAGYDDHPIARVVSPGLTSVAWGMTEVAVHASELLAAAVSGEPRQGSSAKVLVKPRLIQRASSAQV
jgi:LacI family transcriptional regulator, galactose operon repressor